MDNPCVYTPGVRYLKMAGEVCAYVIVRNLGIH